MRIQEPTYWAKFKYFFTNSFRRVLRVRSIERKRATINCKLVDDKPDDPGDHCIYFIGEDGDYWAAIMKCPCGCGDAIELNLLEEARPCWTAYKSVDGSISLVPSVWRSKGCKSHFVVRQGHILWC